MGSRHELLEEILARCRVKGLPVNGDEISKAGRDVLLLSTVGERSRIIGQKSTDALLNRTIDEVIVGTEILHIAKTGEFSPTATEQIKRQFAHNLRNAGFPVDIFPEDETSQLIKGSAWFMARQGPG